MLTTPSDSLFIVMSANLYYLPFEDEWGVDLSDAAGGGAGPGDGPEAVEALA